MTTLTLSGLSLLAGSHTPLAHSVPSQDTAYATTKSPTQTQIGTAALATTSTPSPAWTATATAAADVKTKAASAAAASKATTSAAAKVPLPAASSPARTSTLFTNTSSNVATQARAWALAHPGDAATMNRLASTPMATWFGSWSGDIQTATASYVNAASASNQIPTLVAYNIPERDCGSYSSGGAADPGSYKTWITNFAAGIGQRPAIVIIEPDALAGMDCLSSTDQQTRLQLLSYAVATLRAQTKASVYLDAGNSNWQPAATMASRLTGAGVANATGFSLNVSNFETTANNTSFGTSLSRLVGGKHFVIDTSRNGNGPAVGPNAWCNPDGRTFGNTPTLQTGNPLLDAYLWVKSPGESDGACGAPQQGTNAPGAGTWWPQYVLMLAANSRWN